MDVADCTDASKHKTAPIPLVVYISFQIRTRPKFKFGWAALFDWLVRF
jgi:hypothetical protein